MKKNIQDTKIKQEDISKKQAKIIYLSVLLFVVVILTLLFYNSARYEVHNLTTGELVNAIKDSKVTEMTITPKSSESVFYITGKLDSYSTTESFTAKIIGEDINVKIKDDSFTSKVFKLISKSKNITKFSIISPYTCPT